MGHKQDTCADSRWKASATQNAPLPKSLKSTAFIHRSMSAQLLRPGFKFEVLVLPEPTQTLQRAPSMYQYGPSLETIPLKDEYYVVCKDYSIQSVSEPTRPIGWELIEEGDDLYYRVTQHGFSPEKIGVIFVGYNDDPPDGRGTIGSTVVFCTPQDAVIIDFEDDGEPEVSSRQQSNPFLSLSQ